MASLVPTQATHRLTRALGPFRLWTMVALISVATSHASDRWPPPLSSHSSTLGQRPSRGSGATVGSRFRSSARQPKAPPNELLATALVQIGKSTIFGSSSTLAVSRPDGASVQSSATDAAEYIAVVDAASGFVFRTLSNATPLEFQQITNTPIGGGGTPSFSRDGSFMAWIGQDHNIYAAYSDGTNVTQLTSDSTWWTVALDAHATRLAAVSVFEDGQVYLFDLSNPANSRAIALGMASNLGCSANSNVRYVGRLEFAGSVNALVLDMLVRGSQPGVEDYWTIGTLSLENDRTTELFPPGATGEARGRPVLAQDSDFRFAYVRYVGGRVELRAFDLDSGADGLISANPGLSGQATFVHHDTEILFGAEATTAVYATSLLSDGVTGDGIERTWAVGARSPVGFSPGRVGQEADEILVDASSRTVQTSRFRIRFSSTNPEAVTTLSFFDHSFLKNLAGNDRGTAAHGSEYFGQTVRGLWQGQGFMPGAPDSQTWRVLGKTQRQGQIRIESTSAGEPTVTTDYTFLEGGPYFLVERKIGFGLSPQTTSYQAYVPRLSPADEFGYARYQAQDGSFAIDSFAPCSLGCPRPWLGKWAQAIHCSGLSLTLMSGQSLSGSPNSLVLGADEASSSTWTSGLVPFRLHSQDETSRFLLYFCDSEIPTVQLDEIYDSVFPGVSAAPPGETITGSDLVLNVDSVVHHFPAELSGRVPKGEPIELKIFDVAGRLRQKIVADVPSAGFFQVSWDGRTTSGDRIGSGVYFVEMSQLGHRLAKKVLVAR